MADIGYTALVLALVASVYSAVTFVFGVRRRDERFAASAKNSLLVVCGLVSIAVGVLLYALITHDFQIEYVYSYTSRDSSLTYLITALWAGNDGSLLFWAWLISIVAAVVVLQRRAVGKKLVPHAAAIIMVIEVFFLVLLLSQSNPFHRLAFVPVDGMGLNPMLENPGMIIHPPLILAGYVGFTVPFAFAMAALFTRRLIDEWIVTVRRWMLVSWLLLGVGNIIGAWWAYVELGWGGYWAWDPVENVGLMPWLLATAFLHSTIMQRRRGIFKKWNMVLIILTFNLAIFGTFLTRSGIISSVHTFSESALGPFFLTFIGVALFGSLILLYLRRAELKGEKEMESLFSRESTFLLVNLLLVGATFAIFVGTISPLISEMVGGVKIGVGAPFFNQVIGPILLTIILVMGVCSLISWRRESIKNLGRNLLWPGVATITLGIALFLSGIKVWYVLVAFSVSGFAFFAMLHMWFRETRIRHQMRTENYLKAFGGLIWANRPRYGGRIVHIAIVIIAVGVFASSSYDVEKEALLKPGESMHINQYTLTYEGMDYYETQSKQVVSATVSVYNRGKLAGELMPEKYFHRSYEQPVTEVAIRSTPLEDLYIILVDWDEDGTANFKVLVTPLVMWIWIGGGVMLLGGLIAFWPERQKLSAPRQHQDRQALPN